MSIELKSGASSDLATIDPTSKAMRVTMYNVDGSYNGEKQTYRAATIDPYVAAVTADVPHFLIEGSGTKTITIKRIAVSGMTLTAVQYLDLRVVKHSTAATGGTSTALTMVPVDSAFAAATATGKYYTAAPTAGTKVGDLAAARILGQATTAAAAGLPRDFVFDFGDMPETRGIVLRGVTQGVSLQWATAPATAVTLSVDIEFTEE